MKDNTQDNTKVFLKSEDGQKLILQKSALTLDRKLYEAQAEKMKSEEQNSSPSDQPWPRRLNRFPGTRILALSQRSDHVQGRLKWYDMREVNDVFSVQSSSYSFVPAVL